MNKRAILLLSFSLFFVLFSNKNGLAQGKTGKMSAAVQSKMGASPLADYPTLQAAQIAFQRDLKNGNDGDKALANIGLAFFNLERDSLEWAFFHADTAAKMYPELSEKRQEQLAKKNWNLNGLRVLVGEIVGKAFEEAKKTNDLVAWNNFLLRFPKPNYLSPASNRLYTEGGKMRNDLLCVALQKERDSTRLLALLRDNERDLRRSAPDCYRTGAARQLQMAMYGKAWSELKNFFKANPRHPLSTDPARDAFVEAMSSRDFQKMQAFSRTNPQSAYAQIALDSAAFYVYPYLKQKGDFNSLLAFYKQFPNTTYTPELDAYFADRISQTDLVLPFRKDQNAGVSLRYLPQTEAALYAFYRRFGTEWAINEFITQHFDYKTPRETFERDILVFRMGSDSRKTQDFIKAAPDTYAAFRALQKVVRPIIMAKNWTGAAKVVRDYRPLFGENAPYVDTLIAVLERPLSDTKTENLGGNVNKAYVPEYCPVISADNRTLYFCRNSGQEDVYVSRRDDKGNWSVAEICKGLDSRVNEAPMALSADGNRMLLYKEAKLYFTDKTNEGGWTDEIPMSPNINSGVWQAESSFSPDGKVLVFESRQRNDVLGLKNSGEASSFDYKNENIDLFVSFKTGENDWSKALNLGKIINTPYRERSPFLHPDGRTLYFCSEGHGGFGELDLYKTVRLDSTYLRWSPPIHVGKELNTVSEDWGYKISTNGKYAFYSSNEDIWMATPLPPAAAPLPTRLVTGRINSLGGGSIANALIVVIDKTNGDTVTTLRPDPKTGEYAVVVPEDKNYEAVVVSRKNDFLPATINLTTPPSVSEGKDDIDLIHSDAISGEEISFKLKNLNFDYDKATIQDISFAELDRWADVLKKNNFKASIEGHTDNKGNDAYNEDLSKRRAEAARAYLITKGCDGSVIEAKGFGEKIPIASNDTEGGRALNRRVVIKIRKVEKQ